MNSGIDWLAIPTTWFKSASNDELRAFVKALDNYEIPAGSQRDELKNAFVAECNRRSAKYYEGLNNGEWI